MFKIRLLSGLLILLGISVIGFWVIFFITGSMTDGIFTVENNQYIIFHQLAEFTMAVASLTGGILLWKGTKKARYIATLALGMLLYSSINSSAHAVKNDLSLLPIFIFTLVVCMAGIYHLLCEKQYL